MLGSYYENTFAPISKEGSLLWAWNTAISVVGGRSRLQIEEELSGIPRTFDGLSVAVNVVSTCLHNGDCNTLYGTQAVRLAAEFIVSAPIFGFPQMNHGIGPT